MHFWFLGSPCSLEDTWKSIHRQWLRKFTVKESWKYYAMIYFCSFWFIQVIVMGGIALGKFYWANCIGELYWMTVLGVLYWADCVTRVTSSKLHTKWYWLNYSSELCQLEYRNNITIKRQNLPEIEESL